MKEIKPSELNENIFTSVGKEWMLVTAGTPGSFNMMTASWGGLGYLWDKPVAFVFVRHSRRTYEFIEQHERLSLSFLGMDKEMRKIYGLLGSKSGRVIDKMHIEGLTPVGVSVSGGESDLVYSGVSESALAGAFSRASEADAVMFNESRLTLVGRKLFVTDMKEENFLDPAVLKRWYDPSCPTGCDMHRIYVMEIEKIISKTL
ncbi:MAG: flavin reductase family protein [Bacteroidales bacterium]|nr:flavin reductase family protein [Bacteroidales bacterium]